MGMKLRVWESCTHIHEIWQAITDVNVKLGQKSIQAQICLPSRFWSCDPEHGHWESVEKNKDISKLTSSHIFDILMLSPVPHSNLRNNRIIDENADLGFSEWKRELLKCRDNIVIIVNPYSCYN